MKNFTVYKSSAGSGKTFTLVKEYLKIALQSEKPDKYRGILAITFTNKATSEMKERIISALKALSSEEKLEGRDKNLQSILITELKIDENNLMERAKKVLTHILHHYSDFSISTIDKFMYKIVRAFARDLQIPMNFEVELDSEILLQNAIDKLISKAGIDEQLTKILVEFTERKTDDEKSWNIETDLLDFAGEMLKEDSAGYLEKLKQIDISQFFLIKEKLFDKIKIFETEVKKIGNDALKIIGNAGVSHNSFANGKTGIAKYFTYLSECREDKLLPSGTVQNNVNENKWFAGKISEFKKENINSIKEAIKDLYLNAQKYLDENLKNHFLFKLILKNIYSLAVLRELETIIDEIKKEKNIIHISEFNKKIAAIVSNESAPFIYERLGEKYHHFLIDEFQDTSFLQWQNLLPLVHNSLSEGNFNMVVGDGKQAIYRWRSGDVEQFANLPKIKNPEKNLIFSEREQALKNNFDKDKILNENYRSKKEIVEFNNYFFGELSAKLDLEYQPIYAAQKQEFKPENIGGFVNIEIFREDIVNDIRQKNMERTFEIIQDALKQNFSLRDVCILCRRNSDASEIASFLLENKIDVISSESLLLCKSAEVNFLISFLNFLNAREEKKHQTEIAIFLLEKKITTTELHPVLTSINNNKSNYFFYDFLKNSGFEINFARLKKLPLYELTEELIRIFSLNETANPYISFFLEFVQSFVSSETSNVFEFLQYWEKKKNSASIIISEGVNAVRIMTIHKSKGLEFPIVIFPFANWQEKLTKDFFWIDVKNSSLEELNSAIVNVNKDLEKTIFSKEYMEEKNKSQLDNFNLLYVAFTRAKEKLYVLSSVEKQKNLSKNFVDILKNHNGWNEENYSFSYGICRENEKNSAGNTTETLHKLPSSDWKNKVYIASSAEKYSGAEKQKNYGKLLHYALSFIHTEKDAENAIRKMQVAGICNEKEKISIAEKIKKLLSNAQIKVFFEEGLNVKTEAEILLEDGEIYRPDRVILSENCAIIIDFKTGMEKSEHIEQIKKYSEVLKKMNFQKIEKFLIYTEKEKVVKV